MRITAQSRVFLFLAATWIGFYGTANAQIVYSRPENPIQLATYGFIEYYALDFNLDGNGNLTFGYSFLSVSVRPEENSNIVILSDPPPNIGGAVMPLPNGFLIGPEIGHEQLRWYGGAAPTSFVSIINCWGEQCGGAFRGQSGYMGVEFELDDDIYYGWVSMSVNHSQPSARIHSWAWNTVPGEPIRAGEIPEPATVALLTGIGALGLAIVVRRTRKRRSNLD